MNIERNVKRVETLAAEKEDANWEFRYFLKGCDLSVEQIDAVVHRLTRQVSSQIDCLQCANCCKKVSPVLQSEDIERLATHLGIGWDSFVRKYVVEDKEEDGFYFQSIPCPFLKDNSCAVYAARPHDCRSYPHLMQDESVFRLIQVCSNCSVCPIVFNVYELLKQELWNDEYGFQLFDDEFEDWGFVDDGERKNTL